MSDHRNKDNKPYNCTLCKKAIREPRDTKNAYAHAAYRYCKRKVEMKKENREIGKGMHRNPWTVHCVGCGLRVAKY
jgi:hypothetical protein